jgi:hypothetical protein
MKLPQVRATLGRFFRKNTQSSLCQSDERQVLFHPVYSTLNTRYTQDTADSCYRLYTTSRQRRVNFPPCMISPTRTFKDKLWGFHHTILGLAIHANGMPIIGIPLSNNPKAIQYYPFLKNPLVPSMGSKHHTRWRPSN